MSEIIEVKTTPRDTTEVLVRPSLQVVHIKLGVSNKSNSIPDILNRKLIEVGGECSVESPHPELNSANTVLVESDALVLGILEVGFDILGTLFFEDDFARNFEGCSRYNWMFSVGFPSLVVTLRDLNEKVTLRIDCDDTEVLVVVRY